MLKANEAKKMANETIATREAEREARIVAIVEQEIAPMIEEAAKDGRFYISFDLAPYNVDVVSRVLTENGYSIKYDSYDKKMAVTW